MYVVFFLIYWLFVKINTSLKTSSKVSGVHTSLSLFAIYRPAMDRRITLKLKIPRKIYLLLMARSALL